MSLSIIITPTHITVAQYFHSFMILGTFIATYKHAAKNTITSAIEVAKLINYAVTLLPLFTSRH